MATTKYVLEKIRIAGALQDLLSKSDAANVAVTWNGTATTLLDALTDIATTLGTIPSDSDITTLAEAAVAASGHAHFEKVAAVPAVADAKENVMYLVKNTTTNHFDIYAKIAGETEGSYTMELLDDTTVNLTNYVQKLAMAGEGHATAGNFMAVGSDGAPVDSGKKPADFVAAEANKRLITDEEATKLSQIATGATKAEASDNPGDGTIKINDESVTVYTHPTTTAATPAFVKVGKDAAGHVDIGGAIAKKDLTDLINAVDKDTAGDLGLMTAAQAGRLDGMGAVYYGETAPSGMKDGDMFVHVISEG